MSDRKRKNPYQFSDGSPLPAPVSTGTVLSKSQLALKNKNGVNPGKAKKFLNHRTSNK
ncbi:MAG: hypothetical protein KBB86_01105 [Candidatus Pacebacteria bacterium]|nr:hypothetical protein [Candidatus Paceibacterota bacterium]